MTESASGLLWTTIKELEETERLMNGYKTIRLSARPRSAR